jgi:hypothetical protein
VGRVTEAERMYEVIARCRHRWTEVASGPSESLGFDFVEWHCQDCSVVYSLQYAKGRICPTRP